MVVVEKLYHCTGIGHHVRTMPEDGLHRSQRLQPSCTWLPYESRMKVVAFTAILLQVKVDGTSLTKVKAFAGASRVSGLTPVEVDSDAVFVGPLGRSHGKRRCGFSAPLPLPRANVAEQ
ncbi:hypothetical protein DOTSEDRAFT_68828 [Dothistroma septosporum NZE10]|uniref:Uncharacterized protein n=1 Tax=Dothistroma septosporum (strain NZE10 / CBS 128990) TaxID=675120 RepID=N1Q497_DOTSN|nr:hypothetical protein DOTSEDRAFT_68828 [Dothistroma septosporum NZE10]